MKILETETHTYLRNTSLLRGMQVFTSILFYENRLLFLEKHLERLLKGAAFLFPDHHWDAQLHEMRSYVLEKIKTIKGNAYCRMTIVDDLFFVNFDSHNLTSEEIHLSKAFQIKMPTLKPSFLKLSQYAEGILEMRKVKGDVVYFDHQGILTEATTSNVFLVDENNRLCTPKHSSMVLEGVMRKTICENYTVLEKDLSEEDYLKAKEIWLTNSIQGIRYSSTHDSENYQKILKKMGRFGEKLNE